jgi:hypothetical protein
MATVSYPYVAFPLPANEAYPQGTVAYRPLAIATIKASNGQSLRWLVLPDSGADACLFPLSLAIMLQIDVLKLPKAITRGVGNSANVTYYDTVSIDLGDGIAFTSYVGFSEGMDQVGLGLLGQAGFFEYYTVEFKHKQRRYTVQTI